MTMDELRIWSEMYDDAQKARIACSNRAQRGGVDTATYAPQLAAMKTAEEEIGKALRKCYRRVVPAEIIEWQKNSLGIGEHLLARLLGVIGHPVHATPYHWEEVEKQGEKTRVLVADPPYDRTVSQLWSYCGHGDPARKRKKGMTQEEAFALGNPRAKMLAHLLAESCIKQLTGSYRKVYDERRAKTEEEREEWSKLHKHNDALRITAKAILKDLWIAAGGPATQEV